VDLEEVRYLTREWIEEYNYRRPYEALNNLTPDEWKRKLEITELGNMSSFNVISNRLSSGTIRKYETILCPAFAKPMLADNKRTVKRQTH